MLVNDNLIWRKSSRNRFVTLSMDPRKNEEKSAPNTEDEDFFKKEINVVWKIF